MTVRDRLSSLMATEDANEYHTEEILNVFRESDDEILGSTDVAEAVGMTTDGLTDRLKKLMESDRVEGKQVGNPWVWTLHPDERRKVVPPKIDRLVHALDDFRAGFKIVLSFGWLVTMVGLLLLFWGVTDMLISSSFQVIAVETALYGGWVIALLGAIIGVVAGSGVLALLLLENAAIRQVRKSQPPKQTGTPALEESRGQVTPQLVICVFVLIVLAGPLAAAAIDLQQGLAVSPAFTAVEAAFIAFLIIAAIIAAIFEAGR